MNRRSREPVDLFSSRTSVPVMSAGIKSGVNWTRLNDKFSERASVLIISVFASPGTPSSRAMPSSKKRDQELFDHVVLADDDLRKLLQYSLASLSQFSYRGLW